MPDSLSDEQALFLSDIFPTGYMAAENAQIKDGDTVAIWRCGPVGQFAIRSALMLGAGRVIAIDKIPERLAMAEAGGAETIDFSKTDVYDELMARTGNRGPDSCIDESQSDPRVNRLRVRSPIRVSERVISRSGRRSRKSVSPSRLWTLAAGTAPGCSWLRFPSL